MQYWEDAYPSKICCLSEIQLSWDLIFLVAEFCHPKCKILVPFAVLLKFWRWDPQSVFEQALQVVLMLSKVWGALKEAHLLPWQHLSKVWDALKLLAIVGSPEFDVTLWPTLIWGFSGDSVVKESTSQCRRGRFDPRVRKIAWSRKWLPTRVFLPGESHGQRSLADYSPWGRKQSQTWLSTHAPPLVWRTRRNAGINISCLTLE